MRNFNINFLTKFSIIMLLMAIVASCAIQQPPGGGPKDTKPPVFLMAEPANNSVNFNAKKIDLRFSEYIKLKNIEKFLLISPPLNEPPDIKENGKSLTIKIKDTLRSNTTYKFYMGDAIVDITEGNALRNYSYAFSTGPFIDSLTLRGKVTGAASLEPQKDVFVVLYTSMDDSAPMLERPVYVTKTYDNGDFVFTNLAGGKYRLLAIKDINGDYLYSPGAEEVAFSDSLVEPEYAAVSGQDTLGRVILAEGESKPSQLMLFAEPDSTQRLTKGGMTGINQFQLVFRYPLKSLQIEPLTADSARNWCVREFSAKNDTMRGWLLPPVTDTLKLKVVADNGEADTLIFATDVKSKENARGKNIPERKNLSFTASTSQSRYLELNSRFSFTASMPVASLDTSLIRAINTTTHDTLKPALVVAADSIGRRTIVQHQWVEGADYQVLLPKGTVTDIYGETNDSLTFGFKVRPREEYGLVRIRLAGDHRTESLIFQLVTEKGLVVAERQNVSGDIVLFDYLLPGKYRVKAIVDKNRNGKWDTGSLLRRMQPEKALMHPKVMDVRGNWELEEPWNF
ncbi:MAG TPA: Ig-like domain-containing protein [Bacteroidales bacterium]|nr:Ig-like domain-containing protein [Bacteroidales bacterium]